MTDPHITASARERRLRLARERMRIMRNKVCTDCTTTALLQYNGYDHTHHRFTCTVCGSPVLFDRIVREFARDDVLPIGGPTDPVTDSEFPEDAA